MSERTPEQEREFIEKVRSVGHISQFKPGATRRVEVKRDDDGKHAGEHVEHYDGSQDAIARPRTFHYRTTMEEDS